MITQNKPVYNGQFILGSPDMLSKFFILRIILIKGLRLSQLTRVVCL
jgi:hypothetical protein